MSLDPMAKFYKLIKEIWSWWKNHVLLPLRTYTEKKSSQDLENPSSTPQTPLPNDKKPSFWKAHRWVKVLVYLTIVVGYLASGVTMYVYMKGGYKRSTKSTNSVIDGLYFSIISVTTIGYGDITPLTPVTKILTCVFVLVGLGIVSVLIHSLLDRIVAGILTGLGSLSWSCIADTNKKRVRTGFKVGMALGVMVLCIMIGAFVLHWVEHVDFLDSVYASIMSATTVGFGDFAFHTRTGRTIAVFWVLASTVALTKVCKYLGRAIRDKRHRANVKRVIEEQNVEYLRQVGTGENISIIRKATYIMQTLKKMVEEVGKIGEEDLSLICDQLSKMNFDASDVLPEEAPENCL